MNTVSGKPAASRNDTPSGAGRAWLVAHGVAEGNVVTDSVAEEIADSLAALRALDAAADAMGAGKPGAEDERLRMLTEREREVLVEIAGGATNAEISANLYMAEGTVKTHIGRLLSKLQIRDRVGLVLFAYEVGLVQR